MACNSNWINNSSCNTCKVCIETTRVFDGCVIRLEGDERTLPVSFSALPVSFVSAESFGDSTVSNLEITPVAEENCSRVTFMLTSPIRITALDSAGNTIVATSSVTYNVSTLLRVPDSTFTPVTIVSTAKSAAIAGGFNTAGTEVTYVGCVLITVKVIAQVDLIIPTYGYPILPSCRDGGDVCDFLARTYPR